ncbi:protein-disulfide oxidoreductase DsbI [Helicobacter fennelliae]
MSKIWSEFKKSPISAIAKWQDQRFLWILMTVVCLALVAVAHYVFQDYGYMKPCEQCVYIRYAFVVMAIGGIVVAIYPKNIILKVIGYVLAFYGAIRGIMYSVKLNNIHHAAHSDDPFQEVQGCSAVPHFDFGLPLHIWFPDWFNPTGDCGFDYPTVPDGVVLEGFRKAFVDFYEDGWYLIPSQHFGNMAQCCLLAYVVCFVILAIMAISWIIDFSKKTKTH